MPVYRCILRYQDGLSGLIWTLRNFISAANPPAVFTLADTFNDAYMLILGTSVNILDCRISDEAIYRDMYIANGTVFTTPTGVNAGSPLPNSTCMLFRGFGTSVTQGSAAWKIHGITSNYISDGFVILTDASVVSFATAAANWFKQYRPVATAGGAHHPPLPVVNPPAPFSRYVVERTVYDRKLGRPFAQPGQQHAYLRH